MLAVSSRTLSTFIGNLHTASPSLVRSYGKPLREVSPRLLVFPPYAFGNDQAIAIEWAVQDKSFLILTFKLPENVVEVRSRQTALRKYFFQPRISLQEQASDIVDDFFHVLSELLDKVPAERNGLTFFF